MPPHFVRPSHPDTIPPGQPGHKMTTCKVQGCTRTVSKQAYDFCLTHWKSHRANRLKQCPHCNSWYESTHICSASSMPEEDLPHGLLSSTNIGKPFNLSGPRINLI